METKYDIVLRERKHYREEELKVRLKAVLATLAVVGSLTLIILFIVIPPMYPPMQASGGVDVILGSDLEGMNPVFDQVSDGSPQQKQEEPVAPPQSQPEEMNVPKDMPTETDPESAPIKEVKKEVKKEVVPNNTPVNKTTTTTTQTNKVPDRKADPNSLFESSDKPGNNGKGGDNTSKGTGQYPGDQGDPNGNKDAHSWVKKGSGTEGDGPGFDLAGRGSRTLPSLNDNSAYEGTIAVEITVDRDGNVIAARGGVRGTINTPPEFLIKRCEAAALQAKFTAKADAPEQQFGKIYYNFKNR